MEHNQISFHDAVEKLFTLFDVNEAFMLFHDNTNRVRALMIEINNAYKTFNSLCSQSYNLDLPGNVSSKLEFGTKYWVFKQTV